MGFGWGIDDLLVDGFALLFQDACMSMAMSSIQPKHRKFVREVAKGRAPEEIIAELYPTDDPAVALRRVLTPRVLAVVEALVSARWERTILLSRLSAIIGDERTKQNERITALRLGAQISGYLNNMADYKPSRVAKTMKARIPPMKPDALRAKLKQLDAEARALNLRELKARALAAAK